MHIKSIRISNYKSFVESGEIEFEPGVNLIVGENNAGKTALLEVLGGQWQNKPHTGKHASGLDVSTAEIVFRFSNDEFSRMANDKDDRLLMPALGSPQLEQDIVTKAINEGLEIHKRISGEPRNMSPLFVRGGNGENRDVVSNAAVEFAFYRASNGKITSFNGGTERGGSRDDFTPKVAEFADNVLFIDARRGDVHTANIGASRDRKTPIAQNLSVKIQDEYNQHGYRFETEYVRLVNRVLPQVKNVLPSIVGSDITLRVSPYERNEENGNLSFLLSESGTGVGQVLAMLFVVLYEKPSAIVIDEPNSFLHPRATRELLRIFRENTHHQYFISTHSSEVFAEVKPARYASLKYDDGQTVTHNRSYGDLANTFRELGISPFFPFAMWVEGETESEAFSLILEDLNIRYFPLRSADEIANNRKKKEIDRIIDIYEKMLAAATGEPLPTEMKIVIDREHLTGPEAADYERRPVQLVRFIPVKMYENYLLDADAVSKILTSELGILVGAEEIQAKFDEVRGDLDFEEWLKSVDGATILTDIFERKTVPYKKTKHSIALTRWLLSNKPDTFSELREFLQTVFITP